MPKALLLSLLLLAAAGCEKAPPAVPEDALFPALTGRVVDRAELLTPAEEARLSGKAEGLEKEVGPQFVIVTIPSLEGQKLEEYAVDLGRHWGIGHEERNDGLLLLVVPDDRKVRIEVGKGLERRVTDPYAGKVIDEKGLSPFREGRWAEGIEAMSDALIARLRSKASDAEIAREDGVLL